MTFFVDSNVLVYAAVPSSPYSGPCLEILTAVASGTAAGRTSTAALEEVWHLERTGRAGSLEGLTKRSYAVFQPLLAVTDEAFRLALGISSSRLGANDRLHVGTCRANDIRTIVTADTGFDRLTGIRRVDPLNAPALTRLLAP